MIKLAPVLLGTCHLYMYVFDITHIDIDVKSQSAKKWVMYGELVLANAELFSATGRWQCKKNGTTSIILFGYKSNHKSITFHIQHFFFHMDRGAAFVWIFYVQISTDDSNNDRMEYVLATCVLMMIIMTCTKFAINLYEKLI